MLSRSWFWWGLMLLLIAGQLIFPPLFRQSPTATDSNVGRGRRAFFLLAEEKISETTRSRDTIPLLCERLFRSRNAGGTVIAMISGTRLPTKTEWQSLMKFVHRGGSLLIAMPPVEKATSIPELELTVAPHVFSSDFPESVLMRTDDVLWLTEQELLTDRSRWEAWEPLVTLEGTTQAARKRFGRGHIVVSAAAFPFTNQGLAWGETGVISYRLLETAGADYPVQRIIFDESLNTSRVPRVVTLLFEQPMRTLTLHLLLIAVLIGWRGSIRFGPLLPPAIDPRRDLVDHTDAVGSMHYRSGDGRLLLTAYLRKVVSQIRLKRHRQSVEEVVTPLAKRMDVRPDQVQQLLQTAREATESQRVRPRVAATLIRHLARLGSAHRSNRQGDV